jgi:hypothetical protein
MGLALLASSCATGPHPRGPSTQAEDLPPISPNRPTFSDSPGLVPVGHAQLETGYTFASRSEDGGDTTRSNVPEIVARYRLDDAIELRLLWNGYAWSETDQGEAGTSDDRGGTDAGIAVLVPIAEQSGWLPALTLEALTTLGIGSDSFSSGDADPTLKLLWGYAGGVLPEWLGVGGNLIVSFPTEDGDRFTQPAASLFATYGPPDADTSYFAEWFVIDRPAQGLDATQSVDFGIVHRLDDRTAIDARIGFGLDSRADDVFTGVGISFLF